MVPRPVPSRQTLSLWRSNLLPLLAHTSRSRLFLVHLSLVRLYLIRLSLQATKGLISGRKIFLLSSLFLRWPILSLTSTSLGILLS